jgi:hypothetical protein
LLTLGLLAASLRKPCRSVKNSYVSRLLSQFFQRFFSGLETTMVDPIPPPALEEYLLQAGIIDRSQLSLAKKLQRRQQGPLLMILLELSFIDLEQLRRLLDLGRTYDHAANAGQPTA